MRSLPRSLPRRLVAAAVLPTAVLAASLAGCADTPSATSSGTASATTAADAALAKITVTPGKDAKTAPTIALPSKPFRVKDTEHRILKEGTGAAIPDPATVTVTWARYAGTDGSLIGSSYGAAPATLHTDKTSEAVPGFADAVKGQKVGVQALVAIPASKILNEQQLTNGMTLDDTVLYLMDVTAARPLLDKATGTAVPPKAGLPTVTVPDDPTQPAKITVPSATPLKETIVQPLIIGAGPKVEKGQTIRVRYTGATWRTPDKPFDYAGKYPQTYAEFPIGAGQLIKAWDNAIPGQTVGSRLLLVVQPADGYGTAGKSDPSNPDATIKGDDVMIFVMDILDAWTN